MHMPSALIHQRLRTAVPEHFGTQVPYKYQSKIIAAGRQISDRHRTGLKFQFCEPLASASGLHARDAKTKNPWKYNNYSPKPVNKELFPFPMPQETESSQPSVEGVGINTSGRSIQI